MEKNKVVIVDDHTLLTQAIAELVTNFNDFQVIYTCSNGQELLDKLRGDHQIPVLILMDIKMPLLNGIETTKILTKEYPTIKVIALSIEEEEDTILKMLRAGAKGYLIKDTKKEILEKALVETMQHGYYHTNTVSTILIKNLSDEPVENKLELTDRELEFIQYACTEMTYKEIACKMFLSPKTIDNYRDSVFTKFNVKNRIGLVLNAMKKGLYSP